ncbi:MAG: hypothetical protein II849_09105 [Bacteroidales bacterium]|nr:hypothetical protein [Bacteroidales bacterium]
MMKIKAIVLAVLVGVSLTSAAQYSQLGKKNEFMLKVEGGYGFFMGNVGTADEETGRYNLDKFHSLANVNFMAGVNISQDWFLGGGAGFCYFLSPNQETAESMMGANVFVDFDFRPIWKAIMGLDYQPTSIKFAPLLGARLGGSMLFADDMLFTPMAEFYGGLNWYYWYHLNGMRNMSRNWHSFYVTIGIAYMQQTVFLPIRLGWRW